MLVIFGVLIILASIILGLIVLVQNPKGGGLSGTFGGLGNQFMGVKQTTDLLEKGTWVFAAIVGILCLVSPAFIPGGKDSGDDDILKNMTTRPAKPAATTAPATPAAPTTPSNTAPMPGTAPAPANP